MLHARRAAADLVGGRAEDVVLAAQRVSTAACASPPVAPRDWRLGDEIVVSRRRRQCPCCALGSARRSAASCAGPRSTSRPASCPTWQYDADQPPHPRRHRRRSATPRPAPCPTCARSPISRTRTARWSSWTPAPRCRYLPIDLGELGADLVALSAPGASAARRWPRSSRRPGLLDEMQRRRTRRCRPQLRGPAAADRAAGRAHGRRRPPRRPGRGRPRQPPRAARPLASAAGDYTRALYRAVDAGLRALPGVTVLGAPDRALPVAAFTVAGHTPTRSARTCSAATSRCGRAAGPGAAARLRRGRVRRAVFLGLMPHTTATEVDLLQRRPAPADAEPARAPTRPRVCARAAAPCRCARSSTSWCASAGVVQRQDAVDDRADRAGLDHRPDRVLRLGDDRRLLLPAAGPQPGGVDGRPLGQQRAQVELALRAALQAEHDQPAARARAATLRGR